MHARVHHIHLPFALRPTRTRTHARSLATVSTPPPTQKPLSHPTRTPKHPQSQFPPPARRKTPHTAPHPRTRARTSSTSTTSIWTWKPPFRPGKLPAYDEAMRYIRADAKRLRGEIEQLKAEWGATAELDAETERRYREKLHILQVQSEINLPEVRWAFRIGKCESLPYSFLRPVYRHLAEQKWRGEGTLDLLMERLHQMNVIPDLLPTLHPTLDLRIQFPSAHPSPRTALHRARENADFASITPGAFLLPAQTRNPPRMAATAFQHTDTRLYTLLLVDPDVPDERTGSFQTFLHWMQPNIPISGARRFHKLAPTPHLPYIPPHPQRGTPYHRYVLLLLPNPEPTRALPIPVPSDAQRLGFDVRAFVGEWGLDRVQGGGAHMWREVWDEEVSVLHRDVLKVPEPRFGRLPKPDPYADLKGERRSRRFVL
ncbi:PEBP-like protein [Ramaria rubella]|nr:PEBP-like protein [Ramaria rubella]